MNESLPTGDFVMVAIDVGSNSGVGQATKKVRRRPDMPLDVEDLMVDGNGRKVQSPKTPKASYKSTLMGSATVPMQTDNFEENFELLDGDVMTEVVDGIPFITFSDRVQKFIERKMARTIVVKLLERKIGFNALLNKVDDDYHKVLTGGSWVIYGQYLKVKINSRVQRIEYESLLIICFKCGLYGHNSELCLTQKVPSSENESGKSIPVVEEVSLQHQVEEEPFGPWMLVERRQRGRTRNTGATEKAANNNSFDGSRFATVTKDPRIMESEIRSQIDGEKHGDIEAMKKGLEIVGASSGLIAKDNTMGRNMVSTGKNKGVIISSGVKSRVKSGKTKDGSVGSFFNSGLVKQAGGNPHVQMGSRILKPKNSNVGSFNYVGPNVSVDYVTMSQNDVSGKNGDTSFKTVIVHSNLDKGKHKAVQVTEKENASIILERESNVFSFGDLDSGRLRSSVRNGKDC
ncbi:hypothetical protein PVK06_017116 [Gossypium arboreum]|uniref:CCHC-type domain-containing protein n=1 Tax=Gossypium arboreum TaxID=29729 RepID=A0ABR0Q2B7_GOSAR|nr:hypothetical protein PVK06_017116 [Gossypium arboreum]